MTISSTTRKAGPFSGTGAQTTFPFAFKVFAMSDMLVVQTDAAGIETVLTLTTHYTVALNNDQNVSPGGTVTMLVAPPVSYLLTVGSVVQPTQGQSIPNMGGFYPKVIENALDKLTISVQQIAESTARSFKLAFSDTGSPNLPAAAARAGKLLSFDADGNPVALAPAAQSATALQALLGASTGTSLIGWIRNAIGAVATTLAKWIGWQPYNVFDFMTAAQIADVVSGAATLDATASIQAAINAGKKVVFGDGSALAKFQVTARILLKNGSDLDLNGSTIWWTGSVMNQANKANKWDNSVFHINNALDATPVLSKNIKVRNGSIDANDWGSAITLRYVEGFELSDLIVYRAQASGIALVECCNGTIERFKLVDCAANPAPGWAEFNDLEYWSDGLFIFYGSQNIAVNAGQILNTRVATGRGGIVMEATSAGYAGVPGKTTGNITIQNVYVSGYDRQFHAELANTISARDCTFEFIESGAKRNNCSVVTWNTENTTFDNCLLKSTRAMLFHTGATKIRYRACDLLRSSGNPSFDFFRNPDSVASDITFTDCKLDFADGNASGHDVDITFNNCKLTISTYRLLSFWNGKFRWVGGIVNNVGLNTNLAAATDIYEQNGCTYTGFIAANNIISAPALGLVRLINPNIIGAGQFYLDSAHMVQGLDFTQVTVIRTVGPVYWNGEYLLSTMPTTGTWARGVRVRNSAPSIGAPKGWTRVTTGSGNVLGTDWASEGNL